MAFSIKKKSGRMFKFSVVQLYDLTVTLVYKDGKVTCNDAFEICVF